MQQIVQPRSSPRHTPLSITFLILCILSHVSAYEMRASYNAQTESSLKQILDEGRIYVDHRPQPQMPGVIHRRADDTSSDSPTSTTSSSSAVFTEDSPVTTSSISNSTQTQTASSTQTSTASTTSSKSATYTYTTLPQPFDTSLGNNFTTTSCPAYFNSFLSNSTFKACLPVSLLLQNSLAFFQAVRSPRVLNDTLNTACSASLAICSPLMAALADNLTDTANCGTDYQRQNPVVTQAYAGLMAYEPMYKASCLKDNSTSDNYCFYDALTNTSASSSGNTYPYYTAIGIELPSTANPTCSKCLKATMEIFAGYARMKEQPLAKTYISCAQQIDGTCGTSFADTSVQVAAVSKSGAAQFHISTMALTLTMLLSLVLL